MNFVLNLQAVDAPQESNAPGEPASLSFLSPVGCFSTTSVAVC